MSLAAPPHWSAYVDWTNQCKGIKWENAERATPDGPDEFVSYKSMREFPTKLRYSSGVYVKEMDKIEIENQKKDFALRKREAEKLLLENQTVTGETELRQKKRYEKARDFQLAQKSKVGAKIIIPNPVHERLLKALTASGMEKETVYPSAEEEIPYYPLLFTESSDDESAEEVSATMWTGSMEDLQTLFQREEMQNLSQKKKFRFESSDWTVLKDIFPHVRPLFHKVSYSAADKLLPGPLHMHLDGGVCHLLEHQRDVVPEPPVPGTVYIWLTRDESSLDEAGFLGRLDRKKQKKAVRTHAPPVETDFSVTYARGCSTANHVAQAPIKAFPTHRPVDWRVVESEKSKLQAKIDAFDRALTEKEIDDKRKVLMSKISQRKRCRRNIVQKSLPTPQSKYFLGSIDSVNRIAKRISGPWSNSPTQAANPEGRALPYGQKFRAKTLTKIDNIIGDVDVADQHPTELKWRIDLINESVMRMYYPNSKLPPPTSPLGTRIKMKQRASDAPRAGGSIPISPLSKKRLGKPTRRGHLDPVSEAHMFLKNSKRNAHKKFLEKHPDAAELTRRWQRRDNQFSEDTVKKNSLHEAKKAALKAERERLKGMVVDHMKDVLGHIKKEVKTKKRLKKMARLALEKARKKALLAAIPKPPPPPPSDWIPHKDPWTKMTYMRHKFWGTVVWGKSPPKNYALPGDLLRARKYKNTNDLTMKIGNRYHRINSKVNGSEKVYYHDTQDNFCYSEEPDEEEIEAAEQIQSAIRRYLSIKRVDIIRKSLAVAPLQARTRGFLQRKRYREKKKKTALVNATRDFLASGGGRINTYDSIWKVIEEPKPPPPKKKKKFVRRAKK